MTRRFDQAQLLVREEIVDSPAQRACNDQSFELPQGIYAGMAALLFGFIAVMAIGFSDSELVVPMAVNFAFLTAFFAVPAIFVGAAQSGSSRALKWAEFRHKGIATATGPSSAVEATVLTLLLPLLIFCWGIAVLVIAAVA